MAKHNQLVKQIEKICSSKIRKQSVFETIVNKESGSFDTEDVNSLGDFLAKICKSMGAEVTKQKSDIHGDPSRALSTVKLILTKKEFFLFVIETFVFPHGTVASRPFTMDDTFCYGPGCADMKGGIANGIYAIKALQKLGLEIPLEIIFTSDEEMGFRILQSFRQGKG